MSSPYAAELAELEHQGLLRALRPVEAQHGPFVRLDGRDLLSFSSNNYLDLLEDPRLADAQRTTMATHGAGAGAARLITGNLPPHADLESALASFLETPAALLFNSGYCANVGTLGALLQPGDAVFSDQLNHASIIDGCRLARADVRIFRHADNAHLADLLAADPPRRRRIIVTETLFGMDGDLADLAELRRLADQYGALLMVDEAHALGALGPGGRGLAAQQGVRPDIIVGTLGKAFGSFGAFVAGPRELITLLLNRARSFVFTTALPPAVAACSLAALEVIASADGQARRVRLAHAIAHLRSRLAEAGLPAAAVQSHIIPLIVGAPERALEAEAHLRGRGILVQAIRPPTVPTGTSRLRLALMSSHLDQHLDQLVEALIPLRSLFA